jgi:hypothetical protein
MRAMAVEEECPECGGASRRLLSPGLAECANVITWIEQEQVTECVMQDDPALFYNAGIHGMRPVPVTRWVDVSKSRICGKVYELDAPMTTLACAYRPGGKECGAFAVGKCSECTAAVCRFHGSYFDDRLLCEACKTRIATAWREEEARRQAELRDSAENERRVAAERAAARAAKQSAEYDALSVMTHDDWVSFLRGTDQFDQVDDDKRTAWREKRPGQLTMQDAVAIFRAGGFTPQKLCVATRATRWSFNHWAHDYAQGWIVRDGSHKSWYIDSELTVPHLVAVLDSGEVICVSKGVRDGSKINVPSIFPTVKPQWTPSPYDLARARPWLHGGWRA